LITYSKKKSTGSGEGGGSESASKKGILQNNMLVRDSIVEKNRGKQKKTFKNILKFFGYFFCTLEMTFISCKEGRGGVYTVI